VRAVKRTTQCPTCQRPVAWTPESPWRPFCSERCKLIDLGAWVSEQHAIPGDEGLDFSDGDGTPEDGGPKH
jgi:endogenous inhibitor of DNA gyrase (YacG/DUF329 family)